MVGKSAFFGKGRNWPKGCESCEYDEVSWGVLLNVRKGIRYVLQDLKNIWVINYY